MYTELIIDGKVATMHYSPQIQYTRHELYEMYKERHAKELKERNAIKYRTKVASKFKGGSFDITEFNIDIRTTKGWYLLTNIDCMLIDYIDILFDIQSDYDYDYDKFTNDSEYETLILRIDKLLDVAAKISAHHEHSKNKYFDIDVYMLQYRNAYQAHYDYLYDEHYQNPDNFYKFHGEYDDSLDDSIDCDNNLDICNPNGECIDSDLFAAFENDMDAYLAWRQ